MYQYLPVVGALVAGTIAGAWFGSPKKSKINMTGTARLNTGSLNGRELFAWEKIYKAGGPPIPTIGTTSGAYGDSLAYWSAWHKNPANKAKFNATRPY